MYCIDFLVIFAIFSESDGKICIRKKIIIILNFCMFIVGCVVVYMQICIFPSVTVVVVG